MAALHPLIDFAPPLPTVPPSSPPPPAPPSAQCTRAIIDRIARRDGYFKHAGNMLLDELCSHRMWWAGGRIQAGFGAGPVAQCDDRPGAHQCCQPTPPTKPENVSDDDKKL